MDQIKKVYNFIAYKSFLSLYIALSPILFLYNANFNKLSYSLVIRSLIVTILLILAVFLGIWLLTRKIHLSALITTWVAIAFFSYGHVYNALVKVSSLTHIAHHRFLVPVYAVLFILGLLYITRMKNIEEQLTPALNIIGLYLVFASILPIVSQIYQNYHEEAQSKEHIIQQYNLRSFAGELDSPQTPPDIYFILLDNYGRHDVLQEGFGYDNRPFLQNLEQIGFFIPYCTQSNYALTTFSLSSMLQMEYIDEFGSPIVQESLNWRTFSNFIRYNNVRFTLEELDYKTVAFETSIVWTNVPDAAVYYKLPENLLLTILDFERLNPFEKLLINTTAIRSVRALFPQQVVEQNEGELVPAHSRYSYQIMQHTLQQIPAIPQTVKGPKFVYIHLLTTHYPYLVDEVGNFRYSEKAEAYIQSIKYINGRLLEIIDALIKNSATPPIIILQGDHGPTYKKPEYRMQAFAAYYLPDQGSQGSYPTITPVNLFRLIFNQYFGGQFPLKEDRSYFSRNDDPYNLLEIPNAPDKCQDYR